MDGNPIDGSKLMADPDSRDLPYIFSPDGTKAARSPANRMLLDRRYGSSARSMLKAALENINSMFANPANPTMLLVALESHGMNEAAREAIRTNNLTAFVAARENELQRQENEFLARYGLEIGDSVQRSEEEVDVDED